MCLFKTIPKLKLGLDFGQNMSPLNKLIGWVDLLQIAIKLDQNIWRIMTNKTVLGNFGRGYLDNQSEHRKSVTPVLLIDALRITINIVQLHSYHSIQYAISSIRQSAVVLACNGSWYFVKKKKVAKMIFFY